MTLGERIYQLRGEKHLSQEDLADRLGVSRQSVSKWETGSSTPDLNNLVNLSEIFGVTLDELVKGERPAVQPAKVPLPPARDSRIIVGVILLCMGGLAGLLLMALSVSAAGLLMTLPFFVCGLICLLCRKNAGLWCVWAVVFLTDLYLRYGTGNSWRLVMLTFQFEESWNYLRLAIGWGQFLAMILLTAVTVYRFRKHPALQKLTGKRLLAAWGTALLYGGLDWFLEFKELPWRGVSVLAWSILDWIGFVLVAGLLVWSFILWTGKAGKAPKSS